MLLPEKELRLLTDLIGRKIEGILVPRMLISLPVEAYILLADGQILKLDSCSRRQLPTETIRQYPQLRIQKVKKLPEFPLENLLKSSGEIVRSVQVLDGQLDAPTDFVIYTCGFCLHLMDRQAVSIIRDSFRNPGLNIQNRDILNETKKQERSYIRFSLNQY